MALTTQKMFLQRYQYRVSRNKIVFYKVLIFLIFQVFCSFFSSFCGFKIISVEYSMNLRRPLETADLSFTFIRTSCYLTDLFEFLSQIVIKYQNTFIIVENIFYTIKIPKLIS